jgi:hypothetical protein
LGFIDTSVSAIGFGESDDESFHERDIEEDVVEGKQINRDEEVKDIEAYRLIRVQTDTDSAGHSNATAA